MRNRRQRAHESVHSCYGSQGRCTSKAASDRRNIQNENNGAVTKDGSAGDDVGRSEVVVESLDDQLLFAHQHVNYEAKLAVARADDDDEDFLGIRGGRLVEADESEQLIAQANDAVTIDVMNVRARDASDLDDICDGRGVEAAANAEQKRLNAGESERHEQTEFRAERRRAFDFYSAFETFEHGGDDVHTDTAAADFSDLVGSAEAGLENETRGFGVGELAGFRCGNDATLDRTFDKFLAVDAAAIVGNLDDHLISLVIGVELHGAAARFASGFAVSGCFDSVVNGIANEVSERFSESVEDAFVEVGVFAGNVEDDFALAGLSDVTHEAREATKELLDGNHANLHHRTLKLFEDARLQGERIGKAASQRIFGVMLVEFDDRAMKHRFADDEFADQVQDRVDAIGVDTKRPIRGHAHGGGMFGFRGFVADLG